MTNWGSPYVFEVPGSRTESYNRKEMTAKVTLTCPWDNRFEAMDAIHTTKYPFPSSAAPYLHPAYPKAIDVSVWEEKGSDIDVHEVSYTLAKLEVTYHALARFNWDKSFSQTISPVLQMRRLPSWGFFWDSDDSPVLDEESPAMFAVQVKITRQYSGVPDVPQWFWDLAGCVNNAPWRERHTNSLLAKGTLLFIPASATKIQTMNPEERDSIWDVSFDLMWNPIGWNSFMRQNSISVLSGIRIDSMTFDNRPYYLYPEKSFPFE